MNRRMKMPMDDAKLITVAAHLTRSLSGKKRLAPLIAITDTAASNGVKRRYLTGDVARSFPILTLATIARTTPTRTSADAMMAGKPPAVVSGPVAVVVMMMNLVSLSDL
jgi:hypothetical protein